MEGQPEPDWEQEGQREARCKVKPGNPDDTGNRLHSLRFTSAQTRLWMDSPLSSGSRLCPGLPGPRRYTLGVIFILLQNCSP